MVLQELHLLHARLETFLIAVQVEQPFVDFVVVDVLVRGDLVEHSLAVLREAQLDEGVLGGALGVALAQELQSPDRHARRLQRVDTQRRVLDRQRAQQLRGRRRSRPRERVAWRNKPRVAGTRERCRLGLLLDHRHLVAGFSEVVRGGHANHTRADDHDLHQKRATVIASIFSQSTSTPRPGLFGTHTVPSGSRLSSSSMRPTRSASFRLYEPTASTISGTAGPTCLRIAAHSSMSRSGSPQTCSLTARNPDLRWASI